MAAPATVTTSRIETLLSLPGRTRRMRLPWIPASIVTVLLGTVMPKPLQKYEMVKVLSQVLVENDGVLLLIILFVHDVGRG